MTFTEDGHLVHNGVMYKAVGPVTDDVKIAETEEAKDIARTIQLFVEKTGATVTEQGLEVQVEMKNLTPVMQMPISEEPKPSALGKDKINNHKEGHYFNKPHMPDIKHGLSYQGDEVPHWWDEVVCRGVNGDIDVCIHKSLASIDGTSPYVHCVTEMTMDGEHIHITTDTGCSLDLLPPQIKYHYDEDDNIQLIILDMEDVVRDIAHSIPAVFAHMYDNREEMGFHPVKAPKTIKLLHDIAIHLLRPMTVDAPNENMQEAIQEILWHMNNHIKPNDYFIIQRGDGDYEKGTVIDFDKDRGRVVFYNHRLEFEDYFLISDSNVKLMKYFGIERWAYKTKMAAMLACSDHFNLLTKKKEEENVSTESSTVSS